MAITPPTYVTRYQIPMSGSTTPRTVSVTVAVGDVLYAAALSGTTTRTVSAPTGGTSMTWTPVKSSTGVSSRGNVYLWRCDVTVAQTFTLSVASPSGGTGGTWGVEIIRVSGHGGEGASVVGTAVSASAPSLNITTTSDNSMVFVAWSDESEASIATRAYRTNAGTATEMVAVNSSNFAGYVIRHDDAGTAGTKALGATAPATQTWAMVAVEIKGVSAGGPVAIDAKSAAASSGSASLTRRRPTRLLVEDFAAGSIDTAKWPNAFGSPSQSGGLGRVPAAAGGTVANGFGSAAIYTLANSQALALVTAPSLDASTFAWASITVYANAPTYTTFARVNLIRRTGGAVAVAGAVVVAGTTVYSASDTTVVDAPTWLRMREASGTLFAEYSSDGENWSTAWSFATPAAFLVEGQEVDLEAQRSATTGDGTAATFDNVNLPPVLLVASSGAASSGSATLSVLSSPGKVLNVGGGAGQLHMQLQTPISDGGTSTLVKTMAELAAGWSDPAAFYTAPSGIGARCRAATDAPKYAGSGAGSRSELREVDATGAPVTWDATTGEHVMSGTSAVTHLSSASDVGGTANNGIVVAQAFGSNAGADLLAIRTQLVSGTVRLRVRVDGVSQATQIASPYTVNTFFTWRVRFTATAREVYWSFNGDPLPSTPQISAGPTTETAAYFKAGVYNQSTEAGQYNEVEHQAITISHSVDLVAASGAASGGTATLSRARPLDGSGPAASGGSAALALGLALSGATGAASGGSGALGRALPLDGSAAGASGGTAGLDGGRGVVASSPSSSGGQAPTEVGRALAGVAGSASGATADLARERPLAASSPASSGANTSLSVSTSGGSVRFDEPSDRISYSGTMPDPVDGITVTGWAYLSADTDAPATFFRLWNASVSTVITCALNSDGTKDPGYYTAGGSAFVPADLALGGWYRIAVTCIGTTGTFYLAEGPSGPTQVGTGTVVGASSPVGMTIGGRAPGDSNESFNGREAFYRVWARVHTQAEIEAEWASEDPVITTDLWADWPLESADDLTDHSGNGRHMAAGSTPVTTEPGPPIGFSAVQLDGTAAATSNGSAALDLARALAASANAAAAGTVEAAAGRALLAQAVAASGGAASLSVARPIPAMSGASSAVSVAAGLGRTRPVEATGASSSSATADLAAARALLGAVAVAASGTASLDLAIKLEGIAPAASDASADLLVQAAQSLEALSSASSAGSSGLAVARPLAAAAGIASAASTSLANARNLTAASHAAEAAAATIAAGRDLAGSASCAADATAAHLVARGLSSLSAAASAGSGGLTRVAALAAATGSASAATASLTVSSASGLDAAGASSSGGAAAIATGRALGASAGAVSSGAADVDVERALTGTAPTAARADGSLAALRDLSVSAAASSAMHADAERQRALLAVAPASSASDADLAVQIGVVLAGTGAGASAAAAELGLIRGVQAACWSASAAAIGLQVDRALAATAAAEAFARASVDRAERVLVGAMNGLELPGPTSTGATPPSPRLATASARGPGMAAAPRRAPTMTGDS